MVSIVLIYLLYGISRTYLSTFPNKRSWGGGYDWGGTIFFVRRAFSKCPPQKKNRTAHNPLFWPVILPRNSETRILEPPVNKA